MDMKEIRPAGAAALQAALVQRSAKALMAALDGMDGPMMAEALAGAGFQVPHEAKAQGRQAIFKSVKSDLQRALQSGPDHGAPSAREADARTDSLGLVQRVLRGPNVSVMPLGDAPIAERASLQLVAAQALQKGRMGFGIEGVPGKFELPATLSELVDLHGAATRAVAEVSTRGALVSWSTGSTVRDLSEWVPDSVQRLFQGAVSVDATERVLASIATDLVGRYAEDQGRGLAMALLAEKGLDASAPSVEEQAKGMNLEVQPPDRHRGQYFGTVMAQDHRASLIKVSRSDALVLSIGEMGGQRPPLGASVRVGFKAGVLSIASKSAERSSPSR